MKSFSVLVALLVAAPSSEAFTLVQPRAVHMTTTTRTTPCFMSSDETEAETTPADAPATEEVPLEAVESLGRGAAKVRTCVRVDVHGVNHRHAGMPDVVVRRRHSAPISL